MPKQIEIIMAEDYPDIQLILRNAVRLRDGAALEAALDDLDWGLIGQKQFPQSLLRMFIQLLDGPALVEMESSWHVLQVFERNWELLSPCSVSAQVRQSGLVV